jgi:hypothetical protein
MDEAVFGTAEELEVYIYVHRSSRPRPRKGPIIMTTWDLAQYVAIIMTELFEVM